MIFCQLEDEVKIRTHGFKNVRPIKDAYLWGDISLNRTGGNHGHGIIAYKMAPVSGFVITCPGEPVLYLTGDTVWCRKVKKAITKFRPEVIICNCGGAQFKWGRPITMSTKDIGELFKHCRDKKVVAVHMEAWNHCRLSREELERYTHDNNLRENLFIPEDGRVLTFL
jgi:L-ascorbate metabolism protein UlaG (beta-lactamase superfamily)